MFDLIIIGGGPGGYTAAIRGAQQGLQVLIVEKDTLGGTCLNRGCIPTKSYVSDSKMLETARKAEFLTGTDQLGFDLERMVARKRRVVKTMVNGLKAIFKSHNIEMIQGKGSLLAPGLVLVTSKDGTTKEFQSQNVIIAGGSKPAVPPFIKVDGQVVQTTDQALDPESVPERIVIIGGGVIGMEMATIYHRLGSKVSILELLPDILITEDAEIRTLMRKLIEKSGIELHLKAGVKKVVVLDGKAVLDWENEAGQLQKIEADRVLVATGRAPVLDGIDAQSLNLDMNGSFIKVDNRLSTNLSGVWAIGDVTGGMMLAHKASSDAEAVVENIIDPNKKVHSRYIPRCIWGFTEIGSVGLSQDEATNLGKKIKIGRFPYAYSGAASAKGETDGLVKIVADSETGEILGVHILGPHATDLISEAVVVMTMEGVVEDLAKAIHPHPTFSEILMEAALDWNKMAIHLPKKKEFKL